MNEHKWSVGDIVRLRSGGPAMTVAFLPNLGYATCEWFPDPTAVRSHNFAEASLERYTESATPRSPGA